MKNTAVSRKRTARITQAAMFFAAILALLAFWQTSLNFQRQLARGKQALAQTSEPISCNSRESWMQNTTKVFQIRSSNQTRSFRVHLPQNFSPSVKYPLILAFTGKGEQAKEFELARGLDQLPAITVYPQATIGTESVTAWQGAPYSSGANDITFVHTILDRMESQLCVDKGRIYSVGFSNGGGMSWLLSCQSSDRIAAFAMIAGAFYYPETSCHAKRPAAILNIHGGKDKTVPYAGSAKRKLPNIDKWVKSRAESNHCASRPRVIKTDIFTEITRWESCSQDATVENIWLLNKGHVWPLSITIEAPNQHSEPESTSELMWDFFEQHSIRS